MVINQEYFTVELASKITLGFSLSEIGTVAQFETLNICAVPGVAEFWYGVANFKGSLLWILDSDRFLDDGAVAPSSASQTGKALPSVSLAPSGSAASTASRDAGSHRFFNLHQKHQKPPQKLTVVVVKNQLSSSNKQVAVAVQQLKGITVVSPSDFQLLSNKISPRLRQCCSTAAMVDEQIINIIDSEALLRQLSQESMLVST